MMEASPLVKQVERHRIHEHRRKLTQLNRAEGESMESYTTRAGGVTRLITSLKSAIQFKASMTASEQHLRRSEKLGRREGPGLGCG